MTADQLTIFAVLTATLVLFIWSRWRYDVVALLALLAVALAGLVPAEDVFLGLGHPAIVTVAAVLVLSRGLLNAGVVDTMARRLTRVGDRPWIQVATLTGLVAIASGFMNNVGALALFMPVAIWMSRQSGRSPSILLMPLAFGSLLGGMLTMIGTPPNIILAAYRADAGGAPFEMFDFLPVGAGVTAAGVLFIALAGWRLTPRREHRQDPAELFEIGAYLTELRVPKGCRYAGRTLKALHEAVSDEAEVLVVGLIRADRRQQLPSGYEVLREGDILLVEADSEGVKTLLDATGLDLAEGEGSGDVPEKAARRELTLAEAIVTPGSILVGTTASGLELRERHGINVLAVARQGQRLRQRLSRIRFEPGDILLVQADADAMQGVLARLGSLPLASRGLRIGHPRKVLLGTSWRSDNRSRPPRR